MCFDSEGLADQQCDIRKRGRLEARLPHRDPVIPRRKEVHPVVTVRIGRRFPRESRSDIGCRHLRIQDDGARRISHRPIDRALAADLSRQKLRARGDSDKYDNYDE